MGATAYLGRVRRDLEPKLVERVAASRRVDRSAPLTVLVGSNLLAARAGRMLALRLDGIFNIRFMTFADIARALAATVPGRALHALPPLAERIVLDELLAHDDALEAFGAAAATKGFGEMLLATFDDLAEGACTAEVARRLLGRGSAAGRIGARARATLSLFARYRDRIDELGGDLHSIFRDALSGNVRTALGSRVFAYVLYDFNEMQRRLLERISAAVDLELFVPWSDDEAYRFASPMRARLEHSGTRVEVLGSSGASFGCGGGASHLMNRCDRAISPVLLNLPGEEEEVREICRRIFTLARDRDVRFDEIAVVLSSPDTYAELIREIFGEAGIPVAAGSRVPAPMSAAERAMHSLLALLEHGIERRELVEFLVSAPLLAAGAEDISDHFALWVRRSAEAGIVGERGWLIENDELAARIAAGHDGDGSRRRNLAAIEHVGNIIRAIVEMRDSIRAGSTWTMLSADIVALIRGLFAASEEIDEPCGVLESLGELDVLGIPVSSQRFFRAAERALEGMRTARGRFGAEGVRVLSLSEARGLVFRSVFIPGLAERIFPGPARQDPFLGDGERSELERSAEGAVALTRKGERLAEEALLFVLAMESAGEHLAVSYPRFEQNTGKERIPSSYLRFAGFDAVGEGRAAAGAIRIARGTAAERGMELASREEYDFESARAARAGAGLFSAGLFFERGTKLVRERWGSSMFTAYDGLLSSDRSRAELRRMLDESGYRFAPTALERWAGCPYAYFVRNLLGIEALEEPEHVLAVTPAQRGILVHRILALVFGALAEGGLLPMKNAPPDRIRAAAEEVTAQALAAFPETEPVGLPVFWQIEKRLIAESIFRYLEEERTEGENFVPEHFERSFGGVRDSIAVLHDRGDRLVYFHGRIDRIDIAPDGRYRVIDYKTGRLVGKDQDLGNGTSLQLPVYLVAAARLLDRPLEKGEALYRRIGAGDRRSIRFSGTRWSKSRDAFSTIIDVTTRGIENGFFFASADESACRLCDFGIACVSSAARLFERKARGDPRSRPYLEMREAAREEEI